MKMVMLTLPDEEALFLVLKFRTSKFVCLFESLYSTKSVLDIFSTIRLIATTTDITLQCLELNNLEKKKSLFKVKLLMFEP